MYGGNVNKAVKTFVFAASACLGATLLLTGCKSAPELTKANALALIQAKYDQTPAAPVTIVVNDLGMRQGVAAMLWNRSRIYPTTNRAWADFALTDAGKKVVTVPGGGAVIQWHPDTTDDSKYSVVINSVATARLKAHDLSDPQDESVPGVATAKSVTFTEGIDLDALPASLQDIAHNPGNKLSTKRQADFSYENGAWKLHSIE